MSISKIPYSSFQKYNVVSGNKDFNLPARDVSALYGPGWPISPLPRPEDSEIPREIDYPVSINATLQPRAGYEGLMPVKALKSAYNAVSEVRIPVNLLTRELGGFVPTLRDKKTQNRVKSGHPYQWMTKSPDGKTPFQIWLNRFIKSTEIYDAPALYLRKDYDGNIEGLEYIDGSTLFLIINERGQLPQPYEMDDTVKDFITNIRSAFGGQGLLAGPSENTPKLAQKYLEKAAQWRNAGKKLPLTTPAFTQIIHGTPFSFWDQSQIWFRPQNPATDSPYGETFIEGAWAWINLIAVMTAFELGHYRTGNMPEGFLTVPKDLFPTMGKIAAGENAFNARMAEGSQTQHSRVRWAPEGTTFLATKRPDFPKDLYDQAFDNIMHAIGIPPSELGKRPSKGLGGKGFELGAAHDMTRQTLGPMKGFYESPFQYVLDNAGVDDAEFYLDYPTEEVDPQIQGEQRWQGLMHGELTLNDSLSQQGKQPIGDINDPENIANMHLITAGTQVFIMEKLKLDPTGMAIPINTPPNKNGGSPIGPEDAVNQMAGNPDPTQTQAEGTQKIMEMLRNLEASQGKNPGTVTHSIPPAQNKIPVAQKPGQVPTIPASQPVAQKPVAQPQVPPPPTPEEKPQTVKPVEGGIPDPDQLLAQMKPDFQVDPDQFKAGMKEEQEHSATVGGDQNIIAGLVLDHLKEDPEYYSKVDIVHQDMASAMVAIFMPPTVSAQLQFIADSLGLPQDAERETAENMHITLAYLPDITTIPLSVLQECVASCASLHGPLIGKVQGYGVFNGEDGRKVLYATLDASELPFIRTEICNSLKLRGIPYATDHGFVPHITLAYFSSNFELPAGFGVPDIRAEISSLTVANGPNRIDCLLSQFDKHCGVCPEDEAYFNAPVSHELPFKFMSGDHVNDVEIVAMSPKGMPAKPALWKPEGGEATTLVGLIGGPQYVREEAAYLLDRSLATMLVPVAFVSESNGEMGAAIWYTAGKTATKQVSEYNRTWVEKAAVFDYISGQQDRGYLHNYFTHPDDGSRIILIDNGLSFPVQRKNCHSVFCDVMDGIVLSDEILRAVQLSLGDTASWQDITELVGSEAVLGALGRAQSLLATKRIVLETQL